MTLFTKFVITQKVVIFLAGPLSEKINFFCHVKMFGQKCHALHFGGGARRGGEGRKRGCKNYVCISS